VTPEKVFLPCGSLASRPQFILVALFLPALFFPNSGPSRPMPSEFTFPPPFVPFAGPTPSAVFPWSRLGSRPNRPFFWYCYPLGSFHSPFQGSAFLLVSPSWSSPPHFSAPADLFRFVSQPCASLLLDFSFWIPPPVREATFLSPLWITQVFLATHPPLRPRSSQLSRVVSSPLVFVLFCSPATPLSGFRGFSLALSPPTSCPPQQVLFFVGELCWPQFKRLCTTPQR